ncbi:MAG: SPOR domain-containing protein [bacterium]
MRSLRPTASLLALLCGLSLASPLRPVQAQGEDQQGSVSLETARHLYDQGRYAQAREVLDRLIQGGQVNPEVLFWRGQVEPDADVALEEYYGEITRRYPSSEWADRARFAIGEYRYAAGYYITARQRFGEVAWRRGDDALGQAARYWRGMTFLYSDRSDSLRVALRIIKDVANSATAPDIRGKALLSAGEIHMRLGDPDSALTYGSRVLEAPYLEDFHPRAMGLQAQVLEARGRSEEARTLYQSLANSYPKAWEGRLARTWLTQQREEAVKARLDSLQAGGSPVFSGGRNTSGEWTIQAGAFSDMANASRVVMDLTRRGYRAWHETKRVEGNIFVVVLVGRFGTRTEAEAFGRQLKSAGHISDFTPVHKP